jgi:glycosyltransferase involved in cell wall biosynthesis
LIEDGENGLLVSPSNVPALSDALRALAKDEELRRKLGRKARVTVESDYNLARNLDRLAAMWVRRLGAGH